MPHPNNLFLFYLLLITKPVKKKHFSLPKSKPTKKRLKSLSSLPSSTSAEAFKIDIFLLLLFRNPVSNGIGTKSMKKLRKNLKMQRKRKKDGT
ncbi:unnamed protein product [Brassica rapa subsp. trilocularis]|uniref:BnaA06g38060D protein n=1 Tax=Brassica napus TaxID=3708 RepID=A0A078JIQ7_BRANA|nr:BnaA06g38060D [Brassica napus]